MLCEISKEFLSKKSWKSKIMERDPLTKRMNYKENSSSEVCVKAIQSEFFFLFFCFFHSFLLLQGIDVYTFHLFRFFSYIYVAFGVLFIYYLDKTTAAAIEYTRRCLASLSLSQSSYFVSVDCWTCIGDRSCVCANKP